MEPRVSFITLGVKDLERAVDFYRDGLGLPTKGIVGQEFEHGAVAFFDMQPGLKLALWGREDLAAETGLPVATNTVASFALAHNVRSEEDVDRTLAQASQAGGRIVKPGVKTVWGGYAGYFQDPDGHIWEVAWNPALPLDT